MRRILLSLLTALCCLTLAAPALAEVAFLADWPAWALEEMPLELTLSADVTAYSPFDENRLPQLTGLLKHLSLRITRQPLIDETQSTVAVLVDGEEALSLGLQESPQGRMLQFSSLPDITYAGSDPMAELLGTSAEPLTIFGMDGSESAWLEDGFALLSAFDTVLAPYLTSESSVKTDIKDMGTARIKQDYTVSQDDAPDLAALLSAACPEGPLKALLSGLVFSGKQTLRVYRLEDGTPLRVEWNGNCGTDADHLRKVQLVWKLRRDDKAYRDEVTLTSPALRGTDSDKLTWTLSIVPDKSGKLTLTAKLSYTRVAEKQKTTLTGEAKLYSAQEASGVHITGTATLKQQLPDADTALGYTFAPDLLFSGDANMPTVDGTVTVSSLYGSKVTNEATITLSLRRTGYTSWQMRAETIHLAELDDAAREGERLRVTQAISSTLIRRLVLLPREDLDYLFLDLPEESVDAIINAAQAQ